jgi:hypothetical protein
VANLTSLSERLRSELGDTGKSFVHQFIADGTTNRFLLPYSPVDAINMIITLDGTDISTTVDVEETTGYMTFDEVPDTGAVVVAAGTYFKYFTVTEIEQFVCTAFDQHTANHADTYGRAILLDTLPGLEEYPVITYASTLALYTLATDASFDIDITAPDGVQIPRSERYRQLMQMIEVRKQQYRELCSQLGIGLYKIDVFSLRRISKTTNRYVPIYLPLEVNDRSMPQRVILPIPSYGSAIAPSSVPTRDLMMYEGDSFVAILDFPDAFDVTDYTWESSISNQIGSAVSIVDFTIENITGATDQLQLSLTSEQTDLLPEKCFWDIQGTLIADTSQVQTYMRGTVITTRQVTQ